MKLFFDDQNNPVAEAEGENALLAAYLTAHGDDRDAVMNLLQLLERKQGEQECDGMVARFDAQTVMITEGDHEQTYSRNLFFQAVEAWLVFSGD